MQMGFSSRKFKKQFSRNLMTFMVIFLIISNFLSVLAQPVNAAVSFTINNTDSYGIQGMTLHQFDGANPTVTPKASIPITGVTENTGLNGLAVSLKENALYAATYSYGTNLSKIYRINVDGKAQAVASVTGIAGNSVIFEGKYYYLYGTGGKAYIGTYNLTSGEKESIELKNYSLPIYQDMGGDLIFDNDGYIWYSTTNSLIQLNPKTGSVVRTLSISNSDGVAIEFGIRGISFLPNGNMLLVAGQSNPKFYTLNPNTLSTTYMGEMTGGLIYDLASEVTPQFEPNPPVLESQKKAIIQQKADGNTDAENPEVGDTLQYTIQTRNTVESSLIKNLIISDAIPEGLEFVPGSLNVDGTSVTDAQDTDKGHYVDGTVTGQFGDVTDTEIHTVTFQVKVMSGQVGKNIQNTAVVTGDNITTPNEPTTTVNVTGKEPILESTKTASIQAKADGNTNAENPEVGDTLLYTIKTRNTVENSLVKNLTISDIIPAGLTYVSGSLTVDGQAVTDAEDDDKGHTTNGVVVGQFGDVTDTEWHTLTFQVTVNEDQAGQTIPNTAVVKGDNVTTPDEPKAEVIISPKEEINACARPVTLINGSFEELAYSPDDPRTPTGPGYTAIQDEYIPGWQTTDSTGRFDIFVKSLMDKIEPGSPDDVKYGRKHDVVHGQQFAEINSWENATLYQDVQTTPGQTIYWRLAHKGRFGVDTMTVNIGSNNIAPNEIPSVRTISTDKDEWKYYTGTYTVPAGQTVTRFGFEAISSANGDITGGNFIDDIFLGTEPCVVAEKTVSPEGDVFAGDELTYEVNVKNNGGDVAGNTVFEDAIPEGTEYVSGSLKITNGSGTVELTDGNDDDAGHFDGEKVIVKLGELPNTTNLPDGMTVQFKVKTLTTDVNKLVTNKALINYDNLLVNETKTTETNEVTTTVLPKEEINVCLRPVALINGSFEEGPATGSYNGSFMFRESEVPGWLTTDDSQGEKLIEIWDYKQGYPSVVRNYPAPPDGNRYAELNAYENGMLYQDVETTPGQTLYWRLSHMVRQGVDTMQLRIGPSTTNPYDAIVQKQFSDGNTAWGHYSGTYTVPAGQTTTRFGFEAVSTASGSIAAGNFLDDIFLGTEPCVVPEKTVSPAGEVNAGDELTYEVNVKNNGGDIAGNAVFEDDIPEGTEYIPGSLKITNGTGTVDLTDADDADAGQFDGQKVIVKLGDLPNTNDLSGGMTVKFKVKALVSDTITQVVNKAQINYTNLLANKDEVIDSNEVVTPLTYQKPVLESDKLATIKEKADGNTDKEHPEVGDTLLYTIQTQNTVSNSLVKNMMIKDKLPEGLEYVPGTLKVDGQPATDDEGDDNGHYIDGAFTGQFGDILDTDVHKIEFDVKVLSGQAGKDIVNIATVSGDNLEEPSRPENEVKVYPRLPVLESKKTATNLEEGKEVFEV
ncbi:MAG TPA: isopeptide-forming domain-containing fimbrial protein, partial [Metabacillus sp.]|nr:isopeptide-forming domain-containing fimbrial protein [Metabacillus sp.]